MSWNHLIRQTHRWFALAFTGGVIINFIAIAKLGRQVEPPFWVYLLALLPLAALLLSGLYLFVLPYATRWRGTRRAE
jgi:hypothetical protein